MTTNADIIRYVMSKSHDLGMDPAIPLAILDIEDPSLDKYAVSSMGAVGLFQIIPNQAAFVDPNTGKPATTEDLVKWKDNVDTALPVIAKAYKRANDLRSSFPFGKLSGHYDALDYSASHSGYDAFTPLSDTTPTGADSPDYIKGLNAAADRYSAGKGVAERYGVSTSGPVGAVSQLGPTTALQPALNWVKDNLGGWLGDNGWKIVLVIVALFIMVGAARSVSQGKEL